VTVPLLVSSNNERLSYDILSLIFHEYSLSPSDVDIIKLETLLLVCKSWHYAALGHSTLWCHFKIAFILENASYWWRHVPLRLSRCPPTILFDIKLCAVYPYSDSMTGKEKTLSIVSGFVGEGGCIARRWRSLHLGSLLREAWPLFCVPTPQLVDLKVATYRVQTRLSLPETPILQRFETRYSSATYPNLQTVTDLTIWASHPGEF